MLKFCKAYGWQGIDQTGKEVQGYLLVEHPEAARLQLQRQGIMAWRIKPKWQVVSVARLIKPRDIAHFSRQLAHLLIAGLPLAAALDLLAQHYEKLPTLKVLLTTLKNDLESGVPLSTSLKQFSHAFSCFYISLIQLGESTAELSTVLMQLANHQEKILALKQKVYKALLYPAALVTVAVLVFSLLMLLVVPQFEQLFSAVGKPLPALTRIVLKFSRFLQTYFKCLLGIGIGGGLALGLARKRLRGWLLQRFGQYWRLLPGFGHLLHYQSLSQFTYTLGISLNAGLPLVEALAAWSCIAESILACSGFKGADAIITGMPFNQALQLSQLFPPFVLRTLVLAQVSGNLQGALQGLTAFSDQKADAFMTKLTDLLEPALLLFLGLTIGGVIVALYWPLFELGTAI